MKFTLIILSLLMTSFAFAGDPELGKASSALCTACHGADGNSTNPLWPNLAGQHEQYTERQLKLFKNGERSGTVMAGFVAGLSESDMKNLASYYATQKSNTGSTDESLLELGKNIYQGGIAKMNVPACMSCHGIAGKGNPLSGYPVIAGQHQAYNEQRLKDYRAGISVKDKEDINGNIMVDIAKYLTDEEITAVANYMQGLYSK